MRIVQLETKECCSSTIGKAHLIAVHIPGTWLKDFHYYALMTAMNSGNCYGNMVAQLEARLARLKW